MNEVVARLRAALGDAVSTDAAALAETRADKSGHVSAGAPLAVVTARSIADVQATLRIAHETRTPVVTRGAGTGLAGGAIAGPGEIVLSTLAMNRILEVSVEDRLAVVEPGIINGDLNAAVESLGLWFAPDPASRAISTVGGNIATNAGGLLCAKYGVTREAVLGLAVVLADGRLLRLGHRTVKGVTGLDLTALLIGSEGTLGVVVEATVKLLPLPQGEPCTIGARFPSIEAAVAASLAMTSAGIQPAVMELLDSQAMAGICEYLGEPVVAEPFLLVQTDGADARAAAEKATEIIRAHGGIAELAATLKEGERLFARRRSFHAAMDRRGKVLIEDVCVPRSALAAMFRAITEIEARFGVSIPTVAHAGDGNLHPNFVYEDDGGDGPGEVPERVWAAADEMFLAALSLGGTLTGEHGVGILKKRWLGDELGEGQLELQRQIKAVFDPRGILNPGKVF